MTTDLTFDVAEHDAHASHMQGLASQTQAVASAAQAAGVGDWKMYGVLCSPILVPLLNIGCMTHQQAIDGLSNYMEALSTASQQTAKDYRELEERNKQASQQIRQATNEGPH